MGLLPPGHCPTTHQWRRSGDSHQPAAAGQQTREMRVPTVPPGRTFRSSWKQGWGPDLSMGLGFLQKVTSVTERDRATPNMSQIGLGSLIGLLIHGRERCVSGNRRADFWCTCALFPFQRAVNTKVSCSASVIFSHCIQTRTQVVTNIQNTFSQSIPISQTIKNRKTLKQRISSLVRNFMATESQNIKAQQHSILLKTAHSSLTKKRCQCLNPLNANNVKVTMQNIEEVVLPDVYSVTYQ